MKTHLTKFILIALVLIGSCSKDENNETPTVPNTYSITLVGQIKNENGQPIQNVLVHVGNKTAQTDANGVYLIEKVNVNKSRAVVKASKAGYWNRSSGFIPSNSKVQYCNFVMPQKAAASSIQSSVGGSVTNAGATVVFPVNAFVTATGLAYNGTVNITSKHLPTSDPNFGALIPGGDLMAEDTTGNSVKLISYGMIGVELTDNNGNPLQLGPGIAANIQLPIASAQLATAPASIPLWYFDETKSLWIQEGTATKQGNNYVGQVSHFSWWNCDKPYPPAFIQGYVVDCYGQPLANALIFNDNSGLVYTDQNGFYSGQITSMISSTIYATFNTTISNILTIPALTVGQLYNVPNLVLNCDSIGRLKMKFVDCNNLPINPMVYITHGSSFNFIFANNGIINSSVHCGNITINAQHLLGQYVNSVLQPCFPDSLDLGTIVLCDTSISSTLSEFFEISLSCPTLNINYIDSTNITGTYDLNLNSLGFVSDNTSTSEHIECTFRNFFSYQPGTYSVQGSLNPFFEIEYVQGPNTYIITPDSIQTNTSLTILKNGIVGDTIEVFIQGNVSVYNPATFNWDQGVINNMHIKCLRQ